MGGILQLAVFGVVLSGVDHTLSARSSITAAAETRRAEVLALKDDFLRYAQAYRNAAMMAREALSAARPDRYREIMRTVYLPAKIAWDGFEAEGMRRWQKNFPGARGSYCKETDQSDGCKALRYWIGGRPELPHGGVWSLKRRFYAINAKFAGEGGRGGVQNTLWFYCRSDSFDAYQARLKACSLADESIEANVACLSSARRDYHNYNEANCDMSGDESLNGRDIRVHVQCLLTTATTKTCRDLELYAGLTMDRLGVISLDEAMREAARLTDRAADAAARAACAEKRKEYGLPVTLFVPNCV